MIVGLIPMYMPKSEELDNIRQYIGELDYCYLLDDSANDNTNVVLHLLNDYKGKVEYYHNPQNMGLCKSVNNGFRLAIEKGAEWVLIINPDGYFQNNAISIYKDYIRDNQTDDVAIIAPVYNLDRNQRNAGKGYREIPHPDMTGCLYNVKILKELSYYDENTYFYSLDLEYCLRVRRKGYRIIECSAAVLNHFPAETFSVKIFGKSVFQCGKDTPQRYYYQFRSFYYLKKKYGDFYLRAIHYYKLLKVILFFENKREYFKMIKLGIYDAKRGFYGNIKDRENNL